MRPFSSTSVALTALVPTSIPRKTFKGRLRGLELSSSAPCAKDVSGLSGYRAKGVSQARPRSDRGASPARTQNTLDASAAVTANLTLGDLGCRGPGQAGRGRADPRRTT